jgi:hypothetical protein
MGAHVKRLLVTVLLVVVALAMTAGTAYASTCGGGCAGAMACNAAASGKCPMSAPSTLNPSCAHPSQSVAREASASQPLPGGSALSAAPEPAVPCPRVFVSTPRTSDARGAPHLTSVIRI